MLLRKDTINSFTLTTYERGDKNMFEKLKDFLKVTEKAFTAILVGSIMAIETSGCQQTNNDFDQTDRVRDVGDHLCRS